MTPRQFCIYNEQMKLMQTEDEIDQFVTGELDLDVKDPRFAIIEFLDDEYIAEHQRFLKMNLN